MGADKKQYKEAILWEPAGDKKVECKLCSHRCKISDGKAGKCRVRKNIGGTLYSLNYDQVCATNVDPIEKKPLFHFQPGSSSFSVAAVGCNFKCIFCQNWQISQVDLEAGRVTGRAVSPEQIVAGAQRNDCRSIAYTYTEPIVFMELCDETGRLAKEKGLANVFVSNGYMTPEAIDRAAAWLDGINIDLKAFTDDFYRNMCGARLQPVLDAITYMARQTNIWVEITTLVVPGQNDSEEELKQIAAFIANSAGPDVPWHISRFFPQYEYTDSEPTPVATLQRAYEIGKQAGLRYVYLGNLQGSGAENTACPDCGEVVIERTGYIVRSNALRDGKCPTCGTKIAGFEISGK